METKIFCGQCGTENPRESNFCFKCGQKLVHTADNFTVIENKPAKISEFFDIRDSIQQLLKTNGFLIISIGDYYVQFLNDINQNQINFEAVSSVFLQTVGNKDTEFRRLGFAKDTESNYYKLISHTDFSVDYTVQEIKKIFETIYQIKFSGYKIENDFVDIPITQTNQSFSTTKSQSQNYGCLVIIIIAVVIGIYSAISRDTGNSSNDNSEVVSNSAYDASVYQVERYLKNEYLKDPNSYQGIVWGKVQKDFNNSLYKYYFRHKYRAKNSFGGYVVEEKIFYLDQSGNVVSVTDH